MNYKYRVWLHGLFASAVSAVGNGITVLIVDPNDFNPFGEGSWIKLGSVVMVGALIAAGSYLKSHPLPDPDKDNDYASVVRDQVNKLEGTGNGK